VFGLKVSWQSIQKDRVQQYLWQFGTEGNHMTATARTSPQVNGIIQEIESKREGGTAPIADFSHIASEIEQYHLHHPKSFSRELDRINQAFQSNEALQKAFPDVKIVGARGQDLTLRDSHDHILTVDSRNINRRLEASTEAVPTDLRKAGTANLRADGSGQYTVPEGKRHDGWSVAREVLRAQSKDANFNPSDNQIANYLLEAKRQNPHIDFNRLKAGQKIELPAAVMREGDTSFAAQAKADEQYIAQNKAGKGADQSKLALAEGKTLLPDAARRTSDINARYAEELQGQMLTSKTTSDALSTYLKYKPEGSPDGMTPQGLDQVLKNPDLKLSADEKAKLSWAQKYMGDELADLTVGKDGKLLTLDSLRKGMASRFEELEKQKQQDLADAAKPLAPIVQNTTAVPTRENDRPVATAPSRDNDRPPVATVPNRDSDRPVATVPNRDSDRTVATVPPATRFGLALPPEEGPPRPVETVPPKGKKLQSVLGGTPEKQPQQEARLHPTEPALPRTSIDSGNAEHPALSSDLIGPVTDKAILAQVPDAVYIPFKGRTTVMNPGGQIIDGKPWHYQYDQPYWLEHKAADSLVAAIKDVKDTLGVDLSPTDRNAAGRVQSQQNAIVSRGSRGSNHNSNHLFGRSIDFYPGGYQHLDPKVVAILNKHGWHQGDRAPFGWGDFGHFTYHS
jgi:hypothetical protein